MGGGGHLFLLEDQLNPKLPVSAFHIHIQRRVQPQWSWDDEATISATGEALFPRPYLSTPHYLHPTLFGEEKELLNQSLFCQEGAIFFSFFAIIPTPSQYSQSSKSLQKSNGISKKEKKETRVRGKQSHKGGCSTKDKQPFIQVLTACR